MSYPTPPIPREYRVTGTQPEPPRIQPQPKKATAGTGILGLDAATTFWILIGLHGVIIAAEVYMAWKAGWLGGKS